jgi:hypothetical protein
MLKPEEPKPHSEESKPINPNAPERKRDDAGIDDWTASRIKKIDLLPMGINLLFARLLAHQFPTSVAREGLLAGARKDPQKPRKRRQGEEELRPVGWIIRFIEAGARRAEVIEKVAEDFVLMSKKVREDVPAKEHADFKKAVAGESIDRMRWYAGRESFTEAHAHDLVKRYTELGATVEALGFTSAFEAALFMALDEPEGQADQQEQPTATIAELFWRDPLDKQYSDAELQRVIAYMKEHLSRFPSKAAASLPQATNPDSLEDLGL